jgi:hypothetical protein
MSRKYKFHSPEGIFFITYSVVGWVDVFTRDLYRNILIESFNWCIKNKGLVIYAWVIMTNLVTSRHAHKRLSVRLAPGLGIMLGLINLELGVLVKNSTLTLFPMI